MDLERLRKRIQEYASNPKNVRFDSIDTFIRNHLVPHCGGKEPRSAGSHYTYTVADQVFQITRRPGLIKKCYVLTFLEAMESLGLYQAEEDSE
jgi:hypothetical protein